MGLLQKWFEWSKDNGIESKMNTGRNKEISFYKMIVGMTDAQKDWFQKSEKVKRTLNNDEFFDPEFIRNFEEKNMDYIIKGAKQKNIIDKNTRSLVRYVNICNREGRKEEVCSRGKLKELKKVLLTALHDDTFHDTKCLDFARFYLRNAQDSIENIMENPDNLKKQNNAKDNKSKEEKRREYEEYYTAVYNWAKCLYIYIYIAFLNEIPTWIGVEYYKYNDDVKEYEEEVLLKYGTFSNIGMEAIQKLAKKDNLIAMYELADQYFYGRTKDKIVNYNEAFKIYNKIAARNITHPLACWSLAWMMINYDDIRSKQKIDYVEDLMVDGKKRNAFYDTLFNYLKKSYECGYAGAANLIGKILDKKLIPDEYIQNSFIGMKHKTKKAMDFYNEALDKGYVYARNSIIALKQEEVAAEPDDNKKIEIFNDIKRLLEDSCADREWWATNQLGNYYKRGVKIGKTQIFKKNISIAVEYYRQASEYIDSTYESNWPLTNYLVYGLYNDKMDITEEQRSMREKLLRIACNNIKEKAQLSKLKKIIQKYKIDL